MSTVLESFESSSLGVAADLPPRIRILHSVGHLLRGGIEMWLYQMVQQLNPRCFEHHILVRTDKEEAFTQAFRHADARIIRCVNYKNPVRYARNLLRVIADNGPYDVLHIHGSSFSGLLTLLFATPTGIPDRIVHSHNDIRPLLAVRGSLYRAYVGLTMYLFRRFADCGLAASICAAESMFGQNWKEDRRWKLLYYGIDFKPFAEPPNLNLRRTIGIPQDAFVVGHVGRFHEQKNHAFLVEIVQAALRKSYDIHFLFIGDGDLRSPIYSDLQRRGIDRYVTFLPDTLSVPQYMRSAMDCFVFPSRYEGLGLVAVEAQAAGLPCIISDRVPAEAIIDWSLTQILSLEQPAEQWAEAILNLKNKPVRNSGQNLEQFCRSRFNIENCAAALSQIYLEPKTHAVFSRC